jgi:hypothetical protein
MQHVISNDTTTKERAMVSWVKLVVRHNLPLNVCERGDLRFFSKYSKCENVGRNMLRATLLQAQVLVEEVIAMRMKEVGLGAVIHDGWTYDRMHFFGVIGVWSRQVDVVEHGHDGLAMRVVPPSELLHQQAQHPPAVPVPPVPTMHRRQKRPIISIDEITMEHLDAFSARRLLDHIEEYSKLPIVGKLARPKQKGCRKRVLENAIIDYNSKPPAKSLP